MTCIYQVPGGRVSHFRIGRETCAAIGMHARMLARSWLPGEPVARRSRECGVDTGTVFHRVCRWFSPRRLVAMARGDQRARERLAASVGTGLFMASVPVYGIKTVVCLWLSARFGLHPAAVIGVSSLSTPPVGFVFILMSVVTGHLLLYGAILDTGTLPGWREATFERMQLLLPEWVLGSVVVGTVLGVAGYCLTRWSLRQRGRTPRAGLPATESRSEPAAP